MACGNTAQCSAHASCPASMLCPLLADVGLRAALLASFLLTGSGRHARTLARCSLHRSEISRGDECPLTKVRVCHCLLRRESLLVVVPKQLVEEVDGLVRDEALVLARDEAAPRLALVPSEDVVVLRVEVDIVFLEVGVQLVRPEHLRDFDQLVVVVVAVKERLLAEDLPTITGISSESELDQTRKAAEPTMEANMQPKLHMSSE